MIKVIKNIYYFTGKNSINKVFLKQFIKLSFISSVTFNNSNVCRQEEEGC